jgi:predicted nucleic acid-binding protein
MTVVISDTSPINYLVLIGEIDLLGRLYGNVLIPDVVLAELRESGSPPAVAAWSLFAATHSS